MLWSYMPGRPRKDVIQHDVVGVYHVWCRCVRRAWLCGRDPLTGQDLSHRKEWIYKRLKDLAKIYAVDACVFAILDSHYHLLVRNRVDLASQWTPEEVARRWWQLYPERRDKNGEPALPTEVELRSLVSDPQRLEELRARLSNISWFMKSLNEWLAKACNGEDGVGGHFFQDRFGCRSLLDEMAILACSIYIDLNEIRAQIASTPEESKNTSAYRRILARIKKREALKTRGHKLDPLDAPTAADEDWLCPLDEREGALLLGPPGAPSVAESRGCDRTKVNQADVRKRWRHGFLPMTVDQYLELLDWTGRQLVPGKRGAIDAKLPPIFERLKLSSSAWLKLIENFDLWYHTAAGTATQLTQEAARRGQKWLQGVRRVRVEFG